MDKYIRTYAEIDLDAIENNFNELKKCVASGTKLCAVIKADGYGHGAVMLADLLKDKADYFAVATSDEAVELRNAGVTKPILILSYTHEDDFDILIDNNIEFTVFTSENALKLSLHAQKKGKNAKIHVAVDTGMSRIGVTPDENGLEEIKKFAQLDSLELTGIFSHFACADMTDKSVTELQMRRFKDFLAMLDENNISFPIRHISNSAAISETDDHFDMVRMGISLYGLYPSEEVDKSKVKLIPAMTLRSHITHIKDVDAGEGISYGHIYKTTEKRTIATVCAGYADGYPRALSDTGTVTINGASAPIRGRVCMDQFMIDVTDIENVNIDDEVILFGRNGVSAEEIGSMSMSFNYEVVCAVSRRIPRVYKKDGRTVAVVNYLR
ncbi:MAG: alanine racemase [Clostridia bacterium]|nr:alanine racemase [Clostridia bacterium]